MATLKKVNFHGNEIAVIEKNGKQYVAMKPIVEAMGLDWSKQLKRMKDDPVLSSTMDETSTVGMDGKQRTMISLPLEYLNGWLFKIEAKRYAADKHRFNAIVMYQKECYKALFDYFHKGAAVNPNATEDQLKAVYQTLEQEMYRRIKAEYENRQLRRLAQLAIPDTEFGAISRITGLPRDIYVGTYLKSDRRPHRPQLDKKIQFHLNLIFDDGVRISER